jgi:hypothetical protein
MHTTPTFPTRRSHRDDFQPPARRRLASGLSALALTLAATVMITGCGEDDGAFQEGEVGQISSGLTVGGAGGCSTSIVSGLSHQLVEEQNCMRPGSLVNFSGPGIALGTSVNPYLEPSAASYLRAAVRSRGGTIHINSAFRTLAQQYLLYRWQGSCGIQIAAVPGSSNHESGLAIDVADHSTWYSALSHHDWRWYGSGDVVHFDYVGPNARDLRHDSVLAFQKLWNRNHSTGRLVEDGVWGPHTESALSRSPAGGFTNHGCN